MGDATILESGQAETTKPLDQRARSLYQKFALEDATPNIERIISDTKQFAESHGLPEEFLSDEVNLGLLLGCAQKLGEVTDPLYRRRIENFMKRLVAPVVKNGVLDAGELWGSEPERAGLDETAAKEYVASKTDPVATKEFVDEYAEQIARCREAWRAKGYDLEIQVNIVGDEIIDFRKKTRSAGYIHVPERGKLTAGGKAAIQLVLLKNYSAEKDNMIRHEFYHIEDFWGFFRRGYQESILESVDELHTEHTVGNYGESHSQDTTGDASYFTLKEFWDKLSFVADLDFNLLADRGNLVEAVARRFGLAGLVDFSLMYAHGDGKFSIFETFYKREERPIMELLVEGEKLRLRKVAKAAGVAEAMAAVPGGVTRLANLCTPPKDYWRPRYESAYDLIPTKEGRVYAARPLEEAEGTHQLGNQTAKDVLTSYARALAFAELYHDGEISGEDDLYSKTIGALVLIPHRRDDPDYEPSLAVSRKFEQKRPLAASDDDCYQYIIRDLYFGLVQDMSGVDFAFGLQNPETKSQIVDPFLVEAGRLAQYCLESPNPKFTQWFVDGIYGYNITAELREATVDYLIKTFPQLAPQLEVKRASFDSKKVANFSL